LDNYWQKNPSGGEERKTFNGKFYNNLIRIAAKGYKPPGWPPEAPPRKVRNEKLLMGNPIIIL
jgi:hypothetical protein